MVDILLLRFCFEKLGLNIFGTPIYRHKTRSNRFVDTQ